MTMKQAEQTNQITQEQLDVAMNRIKENEAQGLVLFDDSGRILNEVRSQIEDGRWMEWVKNGDLDQTRVNRQMAANKFLDANPRYRNKGLGMMHVTLMTRMKPEQLKNVFDSSGKPKSTAELSKMVKEGKKPKESETTTTTNQDAPKGDIETQLRDRIKQLEIELKREKQRADDAEVDASKQSKRAEQNRQRAVKESNECQVIRNKYDGLVTRFEQLEVDRRAVINDRDALLMMSKAERRAERLKREQAQGKA